jgi:DNA-binding SARP family transcriptional activator
MAFVRLLGNTQCRGPDGTAVELGAPRQRGVFAMLAVNVNEAVTTDSLIDWTWGSDPPSSARNIVQGYISRLRGALEAAGMSKVAAVRRAHGGYVLELPVEAVDLNVYRDLVLRARAEEGAAGVRLLRQALSVWEDSPLGGVSCPWADRMRRVLELERLSVLVECHEAELRLGRHRQLLGELRALADRHADNEIVVRNLMAALHRSGLRAEALNAYADLRWRLADHLGVDPGSETQALAAEIQGGPAAARLPNAAAGTLSAPPAADPPAPSQLPRAARLIGREQEVAMLDGSVAAAESERSLRVIQGPPGVGKTALAVHWAHRVAPLFPDGQIFAGMHGSEDGSMAQGPEDAMRFVLRSLGVPDPEGWASLDELAVLYRKAAAGRRLLIVLDDLGADVSGELLRDLCDGATVVATTRSTALQGRLRSWQPIRLVRLRELNARQAERMLAAILGEGRVGVEEEALPRLIQASGRTPKALTQVAEIALSRPHLSLWDLSRILEARSEARTEARPGTQPEARTEAHRDNRTDGHPDIPTEAHPDTRTEAHGGGPHANSPSGDGIGT